MCNGRRSGSDPVSRPGLSRRRPIKCRQMAGDTYVADLSEGTLVDATFAQRADPNPDAVRDPHLVDLCEAKEKATVALNLLKNNQPRQVGA